jgi:hypothetical protein
VKLAFGAAGTGQSGGDQERKVTKKQVTANHQQVLAGEDHLDQKNSTTYHRLSYRWFIVPGIDTAGPLSTIPVIRPSHRHTANSHCRFAGRGISVPVVFWSVVCLVVDCGSESDREGRSLGSRRYGSESENTEPRRNGTIQVYKKPHAIWCLYLLLCNSYMSKFYTCTRSCYAIRDLHVDLRRETYRRAKATEKFWQQL